MHIHNFIVEKQWSILEKHSLFLIDIKKNTQNMYRSLLPTHIIEYANNFINTIDMEKRIISYSFLYAYAIDKGVCEPKIIKQQFLKPYFMNSSLKFSISYSKEYILLGISNDSEIGVDIEYCDYARISKHLCSSIMHVDELAIFYKLEDQLEKLNFFYELWNKKESLTKAMGVGLSYDFREITLANNVNILINNNHKYKIDFFTKLSDFVISLSSCI